jgi:hypothetical protein
LFSVAILSANIPPVEICILPKSSESSHHLAHYNLELMNVSTYDTAWVSQTDYHGYLEFVDIFDSCKFYSKGKNGKFELRIMITRLKHDREGNLFNLGFGVWDEARQIIDDSIQINGRFPKFLMICQLNFASLA